MHGYQAYPTPIEEAELARIEGLRRRFGCPVGYQDHCAGDSRMAWLLPAAAIGAGADVIEKHVVDDRSRGGIDHEAALEPNELARLSRELRRLDAAIGTGLARTLTAGERRYRETFKRSIVALRPIEAGETIERDALGFLRAGEGLEPSEVDRVVGHVALREIAAQEALHAEDVLPCIEPAHDAPRVVACIAVRMKSQRLPRKALLPIDGVPMLKRLIDRVRCAQSVDEIVVCTSTHPDDEILVERALEWGVSAYAGSEEDVLSRLIEAGEQAGRPIWSCGSPATNVLTDPVAIDELVELQQAECADYTRVSGVPLGVTPEVMTLPFLQRLHAAMEDPRASEYLIFFAFDPARHRCSVLHAAPEADRPHYALTVDTPEDLALMERIYGALPSGPAGPAIGDVCRLLDDDPAYRGVPDDPERWTPHAGPRRARTRRAMELDSLAFNGSCVRKLRRCTRKSPGLRVSHRAHEEPGARPRGMAGKRPEPGSGVRPMAGAADR